MTMRIISFLIIFCLMVWSYWWIAWIAIALCLVFFPYYYEIVFWGIAFDALYGSLAGSYHGFGLMFFAISATAFLVSLFLKKYLFAYDK